MQFYTGNVSAESAIIDEESVYRLFVLIKKGEQMSSRVLITETKELCETGLCMRDVEFVEVDDPRGPEDEEDEKEESP